MAVDFNNLLPLVERTLATAEQPLQAVCDLLEAQVPHYNWVGFYFMNDDEQILALGPYAGAETNHTRIPYGRGICGQVAESGETFLSQDVQNEDNYLACSIETKAELVVPLYKGGKLIGQLDIDSHVKNPFTEKDEEFLQNVCALVAQLPLPTF